MIHLAAPKRVGLGVLAVDDEELSDSIPSPLEAPKPPPAVSLAKASKRARGRRSFVHRKGAGLSPCVASAVAGTERVSWAWLYRVLGPTAATVWSRFLWRRDSKGVSYATNGSFEAGEIVAAPWEMALPMAEKLLTKSQVDTAMCKLGKVGLVRPVGPKGSLPRLVYGAMVGEGAFLPKDVVEALERLVPHGGLRTAGRRAASLGSSAVFVPQSHSRRSKMALESKIDGTLVPDTRLGQIVDSMPVVSAHRVEKRATMLMLAGVGFSDTMITKPKAAGIRPKRPGDVAPGAVRAWLPQFAPTFDELCKFSAGVEVGNIERGTYDRIRVPLEWWDPELQLVHEVTPWHGRLLRQIQLYNPAYGNFYFPPVLEEFGITKEKFDERVKYFRQSVGALSNTPPDNFEDVWDDTQGVLRYTKHILDWDFPKAFRPVPVDPAWSSTRRVFHLARAYRSVVIQSYGVKARKAALKELTSGDRRIMMRAAEIMAAQKISAPAWAWWSCRSFAVIVSKHGSKRHVSADEEASLRGYEGPRSDASYERVAPVPFVFSEKRLEKHEKWFRRETKYLTQIPSLAPPYMSQVWSLWRNFQQSCALRWISIHLGCLPRDLDYTTLYFPGGYKKFRKVVEDEARILYSAIVELADAGEFLW